MSDWLVQSIIAMPVIIIQSYPSLITSLYRQTKQEFLYNFLVHCFVAAGISTGEMICFLDIQITYKVECCAPFSVIYIYFVYDKPGIL